MNFQFPIMKKLWDWAHENLVNIQGRHRLLDQYSWMSPYPRHDHLCTKSAQKWLLATVCTVQVRWVWQQRSAIIGRPSRSFLTALASQGGMVIVAPLIHNVGFLKDWIPFIWVFFCLTWKMRIDFLCIKPWFKAM